MPLTFPPYSISSPIARNHNKNLPLFVPPTPCCSETQIWGLNTYGSSSSILLSSEAVNSDGHKSASVRLHLRHAHVHIKVPVSRLKYGCMCSLPHHQAAGDATLSEMLYRVGGEARTQWLATTPAEAPRRFDL